MAQHDPQHLGWIALIVTALAGTIIALGKAIASKFRSAPKDSFDAAYLRALRNDLDEIKAQVTKAASLGEESKAQVHDIVEKVDDLLRNVAVLLDRGKRG